MPEALVLRTIELVELHARIDRIQLQIDGRGLRRLLLFASQPGEIARKRVGNAEIHVRQTAAAACARACRPTRDHRADGL